MSQVAEVESETCEGTLDGEHVILTYPSGPSSSTESAVRSLSVKYVDGKMLEISNDQVVCIIEKSKESNTYEMTRVINENPESSEGEWKLEEKFSTNLPARFVADNHPLQSFIFLQHASEGGFAAGLPCLYVVISTHSGKRLAEKFYEHIVKPLLDSGNKYEQAHQKIVTTSDQSITQFANDILLPAANKGVQQTVLLLSGDGGIIDILNSLISSPRTPTYQKPSLALIAMGTGNALATSTSLIQDRTLGLRRFYRGHPRRLPTFTATFSPGSAFLINEGKDTAPIPTNPSGNPTIYGAVVCSWALHASIVADSDTPAYRQHGNARFTMAATELLRPSDGSATHMYKGRVSYAPAASSTTNQPSSIAESNPPMKTTSPDLHSYVLATMVSHLEPGFHISPASTPLDGQLRILRLGPMAGEEIMGVMGKAFAGGQHVTDEAVEYESVESLRVEIWEGEERWRRVCVDGKIVLVPQGGWVEVRRNEGGGEEDVLDIIA